MKKGNLKHYNISGKTSRQWLQTMVRKSDEANWEMATSVIELVQKWMEECTTLQEVLEVVRTERLLNSIREDVRVLVRDRKPKTCTGAGVFADNYDLPRRGKWTRTERVVRSSNKVDHMLSAFCEQIGHGI